MAHWCGRGLLEDGFQQKYCEVKCFSEYVTEFAEMAIGFENDVKWLFFGR